MIVSVCAIAKMENLYIREFVEYYKSLGFHKIYLYDNNDINGEKFDDVISDYINDGFVDVTEYRGLDSCQLKAYQDCYDRHNGELDWLLYCDIDEFLCLNGYNNICDFLSQDKFNGFDMIHINWKTYDDNDLVSYEDKPVMQRFTRVKEPLNFRKNYNFPENYHVKSIIRGGRVVEWDRTPHTPSNPMKCCNANGVSCISILPLLPYNYDSAWINHYPMKTIDEFIRIKSKRGFADGNKNYFKIHNVINDFFKINTMTDEKKAYIEKLRGDSNNRLDIFICTYKDFDKVVSNPVYKVINVKDIDYKKLGLTYNDDFYSELIAFYWVVKNHDIKDYIGFCHYRRYFSFMDNIPDLDEVFKKYDAILPKPTKLKTTLMEHYGHCHNIEDLKLVKEIIDEWFPNYSNAADVAFNSNYLFTNNMFIMKKQDFLDFFTFYKNVIDRYLTYIGGDIDKRINDNKGKYLKDFKNSPQNGQVWYQKRIGGFLSERLLTVFILRKFRRLELFNIELTEKKYNVDRVSEKYIKP